MCNHNDYEEDIKQLFINNSQWVDEINQRDASFFSNLSTQQTPEYLWIGCSDSRVPANELVKMDPGMVFVHRNIANLVNSGDMNVLAVIQYAVEVLKVKHIIVTGHYGCGGVQAAINTSNPDLIDNWIRPIRKYYQRAKSELRNLSTDEQVDRLCEINVIEQVRNICYIPVIKKAWRDGQALSIHGFIYDIKDGHLHNLNVTIDNADDAEKAVSTK
ncbi:MAG: carbonic anhydrase [Gammaproteobacteria bacterium]